MKPMEVVSILLAAALLAVLAQDGFVWSPQAGHGRKHAKSAEQNETLRTIHLRKSVRKYTEEPVTREQLDTLVRAAMAAPTAANKQPWAFVVVTDRKTLKALADALPYAKMAEQAQAAISVCGDLSLALEGPVEQQYWVQDCSAATQNLLLAAESMGLGAVWTGIHPVQERVAAVSRILGLPEHIIPLNVIPIGHPTGEESPKDKYRQERIHWEKW